MLLLNGKPSLCWTAGTRKQQMLVAAALRRRGVAWLHQLAPALGHSSGSSSGALAGPALYARRSFSASARAQGKQAGTEAPEAAAEALGDAAADAVPRRKRGRPPKSTSQTQPSAEPAAKAAPAAAKPAAGTAASSGVKATRRGLPRTGTPASAASVSRAARASSAAAASGSPGSGSGGAGVDTVLLVESPAKAKKIQEFLGKEYKVLASYGHIRDLPAKPGSVLPNQGFAMSWQLHDRAAARVDEIAAAVQGSRRLVLATDPDREGEAISWHLLQELKARQAVTDATLTQRITFTEVTKRAVLEALEQPREISEPLVHAYMARRALDYLYGFNVSPMLWRKVPGARSAGRVQSVALRLVCEREAAIDAFRPQQYYRVAAEVALPGSSAGGVEARLTSVDGAPPPQPGFCSQAEADAVAERMRAADWSVVECSSREQQRQPPAPFTTSTLQQEANSRLGMSASKTMQLAQQLYESGHITYMRTDGVSLAPAAVEELRAAIEAKFGQQYVPAEPRMYKTKSKNAQEAHEAIRPTDPLLMAEQLVERGVEGAAAKLYGLIHGRALACQMSPARISQVAVDLGSADGSLQLRANASSVAFPGYLAAYFDPYALSAASAAAGNGPDEQQQLQQEQEQQLLSEEETEAGEQGASSSYTRRQQQEAARAAAAAALAAVQRGQAAEVRGVQATEHETRPPARYSEGSLVKQLEGLGIGRPSTYAPIIGLLQQRGYVRKEGRALQAEPLGRVLSAFLQSFFPQYVDYGFTSSVEEQLDAVSGGGVEWQGVLEGFWGPFAQSLESAADVPVKQVIDRLNETVGDQLIGENRQCPSCGGQLSLKFSSKAKGMPFVGCSRYPDCTFLRPIANPWGLEAAVAAGVADGDSSGNEQGEAATAAAALLPPELKGHVKLLGTDPDTGQAVFVRSGLYGPYVQRGVSEDEPHFRRQALARSAGTKQVTLESALAMLALPKDLGQNPATGESIIVTSGKFGPFLRCGALSRAIPKDYDPVTLTLADAMQLLATKSRWSTTKKDRQDAAHHAEAQSEAEQLAAAAAAAGEAAAAAAAAVEAAVTAAAAAAAEAEAEVSGEKKQRGTAKKKKGPSLAKLRAVAAEAAEQHAKLEAAAADAQKRAARETRRSRKGAGMEARLALDAAAGMEAERLKEVLGLDREAASSARRGPSAYNLFLSERLAERRAVGTHKKGVVKVLAAEWKAMSPEQKKPYEEMAAAKREVVAMHEMGLLGEGDSFVGLSEQAQSALRDELATRLLEKSLDAAGQASALKKPRSAFNYFTHAHMEEVRAEVDAPVFSGGTMLRMAEMWRSAPLRERQKFKLMAAEERKKYQEARGALNRRQQEATAAALAAGKDSLTAARMGLEAGAAMLRAMMMRQDRQARKNGAGSPSDEVQDSQDGDGEAGPPKKKGRPSKKAAAEARAAAEGGGRGGSS